MPSPVPPWHLSLPIQGGQRLICNHIHPSAPHQGCGLKGTPADHFPPPTGMVQSRPWAPVPGLAMNEHLTPETQTLARRFPSPWAVLRRAALRPPPTLHMG